MYLVAIFAFTTMQLGSSAEPESHDLHQEMEKLTREYIRIGLASSSAETRIQTIEVVERFGERFVDLLEDHRKQDMSGHEANRVRIAIENASLVITDPDELLAFQYFKRKGVEMHIKDGHVHRFYPNMKLGHDDFVHAAAFKHVEHGCFGTFPGLSHELVILSRFEQLKSLGLEIDTATDDSMKYIENLDQLQDFAVPKNVTDRGMQYLRNKKNLLVLRICCRRITADGMMAISECTELVELQIESMIANDSIDAIVGLTKLKKLYLHETQITDEAVARLVTLQELERLRLSSNWVEGSSLKSLAKLPKLRSLTLFSEVKAEHLVWLRNFASLEELSLGGRFYSDGTVDVLLGCSKLKQLTICAGQISEQGIERLEERFGKRLRLYPAPKRMND
jgi:hypothetical protein